MLADLRLLIWLHWRELQRTAAYWLRVVGFDPLEETTSNRLYGLYLILIFGGWLILMWSLAVHEALAVGKLIPLDDRGKVRAHFVHYFPWLAAGIAILLILLAIRKTPLKLSVEDLSYIAASPLRREAIGIVGFTGYTAIGLAAVVPLMTLASMMLAHPSSRDELGITAFPAILTSVPLVLLAAAVAWCSGFWRLGRLKPFRFLWLWPLALLALTIAFPGVMTWPGRLLARSVVGDAAPLQTLAMAGSALLGVVGVVWLGGRVNLITVTQELGTTSQLKSLGVLGRFVWRDLSRQMRDRESLARRTPRFALPEVSGVKMLVARAALIFLRQPLRFALAVLRATFVVAAGVWLAVAGAPALAWLCWLTFAMLLPSRDVLGVYSADQSNAFLRQFITCDNLELLAIDTFLPFAVLCLLGFIGWGLLAALAGISVVTVPLMVAFGAQMLLSQGAALVRAPGGDPTVASLLFTGLGFGITLLLAEFVNPGTALVASLVVCSLLAMTISTSGHFSAAAFSSE